MPINPVQFALGVCEDDPKAFDAKQATKAMKKGLPDWRSMRSMMLY